MPSTPKQNKPRFTHYPGQQALRKGRVSLPGHAYVLTTSTEQRRPLFKNPILGRIVVKEMRRLHEQQAVNSLAFVIMPDHLHWLFILGEGWTLAQLARTLKGRSARIISQQENYQKGQKNIQPVWQRGYYDHSVRDDEDLHRMARYIVANPLRAGLVKQLSNYPLWDALWLTDTLNTSHPP